MAEIRVKSTGTIKLFENDNTSNITIASPASLGADRTITLPDASVTLASGTMLATDGSGASLTALNASELGSGTVPTARLGSGTASSSTILYGDQTYKAEPTGGKILQVVSLFEDATPSGIGSTTSTMATSGIEIDITPSATSSKIYIIFSTGYMQVPSSNSIEVNIKRDSTFLGTGAQDMAYNNSNFSTLATNLTLHVVDSPSTTSAVTYSVWIGNTQSSGTVNIAGTGSTYCLSAMEIGA
jgi:hypothetical protein